MAPQPLSRGRELRAVELFAQRWAKEARNSADQVRFEAVGSSPSSFLARVHLLVTLCNFR